MIGLEYVCKVYKMEQKVLSEKLRVAAPNISAWIKGTREIPTKYLHDLSKIFNGLSPDYFQRELNKVDELEIQIYHIEKSMEFEERQEEYNVYALDDPETLIVEETYDLYEKNLKYLYQELNKLIKENSYQDRFTSLLELVRALNNEQKAETFKDKNAEDFIVGKLNNFMDFLSKFQVKDISATDLVVNYFMSYKGIEQVKWGEQDVLPNEKLLAFYSDLEQTFKKHKLI